MGNIFIFLFSLTIVLIWFKADNNSVLKKYLTGNLKNQIELFEQKFHSSTCYNNIKKLDFIRFFIVLLYMLLIFLLMPLVNIYNVPIPVRIFWCFLIVIPIYTFFAAFLENIFKQKLLAQFCTIFDNFEYKNGSLSTTVCNTKVYKTEENDNDTFLDKKNNIEIVISKEGYYTKNGALIKLFPQLHPYFFNGIILKINTNSVFPCDVIVKEKSITDIEDKYINKLTKISVEDISFNSKYDVYTNNEYDALEILSSDFLKILKSFKLFDYSYPFYSVSTLTFNQGESSIFVSVKFSFFSNIFGVYLLSSLKNRLKCIKMFIVIYKLQTLANDIKNIFIKL